MYDFAGYGDKMKMVLASDAEYDICYTSSWSSNYYYYAGKGKYLPLNAYLEGRGDAEGDDSAGSMGRSHRTGKLQGIPSNQVFFSNRIM